MTAGTSTVRALYRLLGAKDPVTVQQGIDLLDALNDRDAYVAMAEGLDAEDRVVRDNVEWRRLRFAKTSRFIRTVREPHRVEVAVRVLRGAGTLDDVEALDLSETPLASLAPLGSLPQLRRLNLSGWRSLTDLTGVRAFPGLRDLKLRGCASLAEIAGIEHLTALQTLDLSRCHAVRRLNGLESLTSLESLRLDYCGALHRIDEVASLPALKSLSLNYCGSLTSLAGVEQVTSLERLFLSGCLAVSPENRREWSANVFRTELLDERLRLRTLRASGYSVHDATEILRRERGSRLLLHHPRFVQDAANA